MKCWFHIFKNVLKFQHAINSKPENCKKKKKLTVSSTILFGKFV